MRRIAAAFAIAAIASLSVAQAPQTANPAHLAALAERIAKLHAQTGQGVLPDRSRRALGTALREFDASLADAIARAPASEIRDNYVLLGLLWKEYRDFVARPATRENARRLRERTEEIVWVASKGARLAQEHSRSGMSASAKRAEDAALYAQRIAKLYLWQRWDLRDDALARELRDAEENLRRTLDTLLAAPGNSAEVAAELQVADNQQRFMAEAARQTR